MGGVVLAGLAVVFVLRLENTIVVENEPTYEVVQEPMEAVPGEPEEQVLSPSNPKLKILPTGVGYLNVRSGPGVGNTQIGRVTPGDEYEYTEKESGWYRIVISEALAGWVSGQYVQALE